MRKGIYGLFQVLVLAGLVWAGWWAWQTFAGGDRRGAAQAEVLDIDKDCRVFPDTGQCVCRHARTGERLALPYGECRERARRN